MRVLLVDDDVFILRALGRSLRGLHAVTTAISASEAFALLAARAFDVILCDLNMPGMGGAEFVNRLAPHNAAHVIFMTGDDPEYGVAPLGPTLRKPFTKSEMLAAIDAVISAPPAAA